MGSTSDSGFGRLCRCCATPLPDLSTATDRSDRTSVRRLVVEPSTRSSAGMDLVGIERFHFTPKQIANRVAVFCGGLSAAEIVLDRPTSRIASEVKLTRDGGRQIAWYSSGPKGLRSSSGGISPGDDASRIPAQCSASLMVLKVQLPRSQIVDPRSFFPRHGSGCSCSRSC